MDLKKIKYSMAVEFIFSLIKIGEKEQLKSAEEYFLDKNSKINNYINNVKRNSITLMKNDISFFCSDFLTGLLALLSWSVVNEFVNIEQFLKAFNRLKPEEFMDFYFKHYQISFLNRNEIESELKNKIIDRIQIDSKDYQVLKDFIQQPERMKNRFYNFLTSYYETYFVTEERYINEFLKKKVKEHNEILNKNQNEFYKYILVFMNKNLNDIEYVNLIYCTYFGEFSTCVLNCSKTNIYFYGYALEQKLTSNYKHKIRKEFLKLLQDDTRYEIIKLLSKKKWYGKELASYFGLTTATLSYHLGKITTFNIINISTGINKRIYYSLDKKQFIELYNTILLDILDDVT